MLFFVAMIRLFLSLILLSTSTFAAPLSCDEARSARLPGRELLRLAEKVCGPFVEDRDGPQDQEPITAAQKLVYEYTVECYKRMNPELRKKPSEADAQIIEAARQLDAILCDYPVHHGPTYRGANLPSEVLDQYLKSQTIQMEAFSSASESPVVGCQFSGNTIFILHSKAGRVISHHARYDDEKEILFRIGTEFKVLRVTDSVEEIKAKTQCAAPRYLIELEEV